MAAGEAALWALAAVLAAIAMFKASTIQGALAVRVLAWTLGAGALAGAAWLSLQSRDNYGLLRALSEAAGKLDRLHESVLGQALMRNLAGFMDYLPPLADFAIMVAAALGLLCLFAFSPGERLEKTVRPLLTGLIGVVIGGVATLAVVAIGFGGEGQRRQIVGQITSAADIHDGDTIWLGATSVRLYGLDAPEKEQSCWVAGGKQRCGEAAQRVLQDMLKGALISCSARTSGTGKVTESFGRPLARCEARFEGTLRSEEAPSFEITGQMIALGYGFQYKGDADFGFSEVEGRARAASAGLWRGCTLRPETWRRDRVLRERFEAAGPNGLPKDALIGNDCPG
jgi:endonuclease YncB( thermonuclease family)